ncbi:MAG TPA: CPXCG motif-containing cysteine-rich protein [Gemmatimonadales bacterium]|nr:CPXCG motif-containing cysteine-rich protein [Gemmatimonadales bacterium]
MADETFDPDQDEELDEFDDGDSSLEAEAEVACPYCGETSVIDLDPDGGPVQEYVEDCQVCCRPWRVFLSYAADGSADVSVVPEDEE